jgi:hypothetical protein
MDQQQLRDKLVQLHDELERTDAMDENTRQVLADLSKDIQDLLDRPHEDIDRRSLNRRLRADLATFESAHPKLTEAMERAIDALVQMGV